MKPNHQPIPIESNLSGEDFNFSISQNRIIFEILRSKMYANPTGSLIREISSNALDANNEAGNSHIPITISLPGDYLIIKDDGPGISPDRMENVFCVYGESTKRDTDELMGGYGLGGKSIFAYSDTFYIETTT